MRLTIGQIYVSSLCAVALVVGGSLYFDSFLVLKTLGALLIVAMLIFFVGMTIRELFFI